MIKKALQILIITLALQILFLGLETMFDPISVVEKWGISPIGNTGLNSLRSMFPGVLIGSGLMMIIGVWQKNTTWFLAAALIILVVAFGRIFSFGIDGFDSSSLPAMIFEIVVGILLLYSNKKLG